MKGGVLIVGSLLWQDYLNEKGDNIRLNWRTERLNLKEKIPVKVPIRYGRISSFSQIPTIVFSNAMREELGTGFVVPFLREINTKEEVLIEAKALSIAEGMKGNLVTSWGVLCHLCNGKISTEDKNLILQEFTENRNRDFKIEKYKVGNNENSCVSKDFSLKIDWIESFSNSDKERLDSFDFVLATATEPTNPKPDINRIAELTAADSKRYYYLNNVLNGITTSQDFEISQLLDSKKWHKK